MRAVSAGPALAVAFALLLLPAVLSYGNGQCPPRTVRTFGTFPAAVYHVSYGGSVETEHVYLENGVLPGVQTGRNEILLGDIYGFDRFCYHPVPGERDYLVV